MEGWLANPEICTALIDKPRQNPPDADHNTWGSEKFATQITTNTLRHTRRNLAIFELSSSAMCKLAAALMNPFVSTSFGGFLQTNVTKKYIHLGIHL
jgi:hypothetical protein